MPELRAHAWPGPPGCSGVATIASRILGLVREQVLAYYFGAGDANDAFRVASSASPTSSATCSPKAR